MRRSIGFHSIGVALLCAAAPAWAGSQPNTQVSLHPSVTSIRPGSTFDVAIRFELTDDWHLYWKNPGDSGLAPRVEWDLPPGFSLGALRFPAPQRHTGVGNLVTHILEGSPCLIQTITAPEELPPEAEVVLTAKLNWLACKTACVREQRAVSLRLAIGDTDLTPNPQHLAVLERAHRSLPIAPDASKRFKLTVVPPTGPLRPGQSSEVMLDMSIGRGSHVQSNQPSIAAFIPTHAFVERSDALDIGKAEYPPAREHVHPQLGKMSEYRGDVRIRIPFQVREEAAGDQATLAGVLTAQACDDRTGTCYPPEHVAWAVHLPLVETATVASATPNQEPSVGGAREGSPPPSEAPPPGEPEPSAAAEKASGDSVQSFLERLGLPGLLVGCFLYGLFINATPCVLPLLSIKVLGFVQQAHESRTRTLLLGLSFGGGVILFFIVLGFLASRGQNVLHHPEAVIALGAVVMALALSMLGVYTLQVPTTATRLDSAIQQEGLVASFGKGALAPVLGFACTGPLLAGAFGWATQQTPAIAFFAFLLAGLGMASPYMLLGANPRWLSFLPKPGPWMITFERIMGFLLLAMVVWLLHPLVHHLGSTGLEWTLVFLVTIATSCWILGRVDFNMSWGRRWRYRGGALALVVGSGLLIYGPIHPLREAVTEQASLRAELASLRAGATPTGEGAGSKIHWRSWSPAVVDEAVRSGRTVLVDFTAAYCTVCKQNKAVATNTPEVLAKLDELGVETFQGDFTDGDPEVFAVLRRHSRAGVPLNLIYPAGKPDQPIVLRPSLTKGYLLEKLTEAGPSLEADGQPDGQRKGGV